MVKMNMKSKFEAQTLDMVEAAQECCDAYQEVLACGADMEELHTVMSNIQFVKDTIQANGVQWYIDNCDPENQFAHLYGCTGKLKDAWMKKADAAMEGVLATIWDKIKEWWGKFVAWIKGLFKGGKKQVEDNVNEAKETSKAAGNVGDCKEGNVVTRGLKRVKSGVVSAFNWFRGGASQEALSDEKIKAIKGTLPNLNFLNTLMDDFLPEVIKLLEDAAKDADAYLTRVESDSILSLIKTKYEDMRLAITYKKKFEKIGAAVEKLANVSGAEAKAGDDGKVTLGDIGIYTGSGVDQYISHMNACISLIDKAERMATDLASKHGGTIAKLIKIGGDSEAAAEFQKVLRDITQADKSKSRILHDVREICIALSEVAKDLANAKAAYAKAA